MEVVVDLEEADSEVADLAAALEEAVSEAALEEAASEAV